MSDPWTKFRNLCSYYADCIKYSEKSQEYLFPDQLGRSFMMPRLPFNWHIDGGEIEVQTSPNETFVRALLLKASEEDELFLGYPLNAFKSPEGNECLCPIMMFPVAISPRGAGLSTGFKLKIDKQGISLNEDWVEYHVPKSEQRAFRRAYDYVSDEFGSLNVELVLDYIRNYFHIDSFSPNSMDFSVRRANAVNGLLNTAVLFAATKTTYTKNLLYELKRIGSESDAILDRTALAYVFRDPPLPNQRDESEQRKIPVSFLKRDMNAMQFEAVEDALNRPLSKVTGPPGTGKSFTSVNLIANEVLNGGSVLFTSRNHKAIHAIFSMAPEAIECKDLPLMAFCTTPENPNAADWSKSKNDVVVRVDKAKSIVARNRLENAPPTPAMAIERLNVALSAYRDAERHVREYQRLRGSVSNLERILSEINTLIPATIEPSKDSPGVVPLLEQIDAILEQPKQSALRLWLRTIVRFMFRRATGCIDVRKELAVIAPHLSSVVVSDRTRKKEIRRLLKILRFRELVLSLLNEESKVLKQETSEFNYEELKKVVAEAIDTSKNCVQAAYESISVGRISDIEDPETLVDRVKASSSAALTSHPLAFISQIDDGKEYDKAIADYEEFLRVFPAWAVTMLSLKKASPCLPAIFSLSIIDEASQCDIPPMIPVLYRSRRATIVGDPNQFPPVMTLKERRDASIRRKYHLESYEYNRFAYCGNNAFSVTPGHAVMLTEHFRCADDIAAYFNDEFYDGNLSLCNENGRTQTNAVGQIKPGMLWIDAPGGDDAEIEAAMEELRELKKNNFSGSIGIISPLRELVNALKTRIAENRAIVPAQLDVASGINTANGFQGGECDVIIFLLGLNGSRSHGQEWYVTAPENKYIYNVSVSRAKCLFIAVGDRKRVDGCALSYIKKLIPELRPPRKISVGPGEDKLRIALMRAGVETVAQYPVLNRFLDLAIPSLKIDIEVDGQAWHLDRNGCRKADDIMRDLQLEAAGWKVVRFWQNRIVNDIQGCVEEVKRTIKERTFVHKKQAPAFL